MPKSWLAKDHSAIDILPRDGHIFGSRPACFPWVAIFPPSGGKQSTSFCATSSSSILGWMTNLPAIQSLDRRQVEGSGRTHVAKLHDGHHRPFCPSICPRVLTKCPSRSTPPLLANCYPAVCPYGQQSINGSASKEFSTAEILLVPA